MSKRIKISPKGKKAEALIRQGIKQGLSANKIQKLLIEHGLGYQRKTLLADIRALRKKPKRKPKPKPEIKIEFTEECCPSERLREAMMDIWGCDEDTFYDTYFEWLKEYCKAKDKDQPLPPFPYEA